MQVKSTIEFLNHEIRQVQKEDKNIVYPIHRFLILQGHRFQNYPLKVKQTFKINYQDQPYRMPPHIGGEKLIKSKTVKIKDSHGQNMF